MLVIQRNPFKKANFLVYFIGPDKWEADAEFTKLRIFRRGRRAADTFKELCCPPHRYCVSPTRSALEPTLLH